MSSSRGVFAVKPIYNKHKTFRAEKRNKHARVLTARKDPRLKNKMAGILSIVSVNKKKVAKFIRFPNFPVSSNILSSLMESWCNVFVGNQFFSDKINMIKLFRTLYFPPP